MKFSEILGALQEIHELLQRYGHPEFRVLITTSPVPLSATYSGEDILVANMYSKSVQRAAIGEFVSKHSNVDYFPSYESVILGNSDLVWEPDQRHVTRFAVEAIMERVLNAYGSDGFVFDQFLTQIGDIDRIVNEMEVGSWSILTDLASQIKSKEKTIEELKMEIVRLKS